MTRPEGLTGDCEKDCQERCAYPGRFSECSTPEIGDLSDHELTIIAMDLNHPECLSARTVLFDRCGETPK